MKDNNFKNGDKHIKGSKKIKRKHYYTRDKEYNNISSSGDDEYDSEETFDQTEYRKLLSELFPSKYSKKRAREASSKKPKKKKQKKREKEQYESESVSGSDTDECDGSSEYDSDEPYTKDVKKSNFNIIFTMGGDKYDDEDYDSEDDSDYEEDDSDYCEEEDSDYCEEEEEEEEEVEEDDETEEEDEEEKVKKPKKKKINDEVDSENKFYIDKFKNIISNMTDKDKKNPFTKQMISDFNKREKEYNKLQKSKTNKARKKNTKAFKKLLREKNVMNDTNYFKNKITLDEQKLIIKQIEEIKKECNVDKPYRLALLDAEIPISYKACAYRKINTLKYMEPGSGEYHKIKNWVDTFMQIPFGKHKTLPLTIDDGVDKCHDFMESSKEILDNAVFGLDDAKLQIMQFVGQWIANPSAIGTAIAIKGPMGTGKTTLVKEGISKILGRDFAFIALGGATDSSFLEGHSYTYEGSTWGKIVEILIQTKSMNPVIYFDELDKLSDTPKGEEIAGILTHLTDTSQNSKFHDKYFAEIDFDLSRCLFIFSYNDESRVNPILLDRMYRIQTKGYDKKEKTTIVNNYLLPKIRKQVKFDEEDVTIPEETIHYIIDTYTDGESGVRNLKRCLEVIYTKLNLYRLMKPGSNIFEKNLNIDIKFPAVITVDIISKLLKKTEDTSKWNHMYM